MIDELLESARRELLRHLDSQLDGHCDEAGKARIAALLQEFPPLRRVYVLYMGQAASLHSIAAEIDEGAQITVYKKRSPAFLFNVGASLAAIAATAWLLSRPSPPAQPLATLLGNSDGAVWSFGESPNPGDPLFNELHTIERGFVELKMQGGASACVEAPAAFRLLDDSTIELVYGKIASTVGQEAVGFTVELPQGPIVDLGTRFGVELARTADSFAPAEVHVIDGLTEFHASSAAVPSSYAVQEGQALAIPEDPNAVVVRMPADLEKFVYTLGDVPLGLKLPFLEEFVRKTALVDASGDDPIFVNYLGSEARPIVGRLTVSTPFSKTPLKTPPPLSSAGMLVNRDLRATSGTLWSVGMDLGIGRDSSEPLSWLGFEIRSDSDASRENSPASSLEAVSMLLSEEGDQLIFTLFQNGRKLSSHHHSLTPTQPRDPIAALGVALVFNETAPIGGATGGSGQSGQSGNEANTLLSLEIDGETVLDGIDLTLPSGGRYLHLIGDGAPTSFHVFDNISVRTR